MVAPGRGLQGLTDRVEAVGGTFAVRDGAPRGTVVRAVLPLGGPRDPAGSRPEVRTVPVGT